MDHRSPGYTDYTDSKHDSCSDNPSASHAVTLHPVECCERVLIVRRSEPRFFWFVVCVCGILVDRFDWTVEDMDSMNVFKKALPYWDQPTALGNSIVALIILIIAVTILGTVFGLTAVALWMTTL